MRKKGHSDIAIHTHTHNCSWDRCCKEHCAVWSGMVQASPVQVWREVSPGKWYVSRSLMAGEWVARKGEVSKVGQRKECLRQEGRVQKLSWQEKTWGPRSLKGFPGGSVVKNLPGNVGDAGHAGSIPQSGRSPGGGSGNPLQHSCLENPMGRRTWWATVHGVAKTRTRLSTHAPEVPKNIQQDHNREQRSNGEARGGLGWAGPSSKMLEAMPSSLIFILRQVGYPGRFQTNMMVWSCEFGKLLAIFSAGWMEETSEKRLMPASGWRCWRCRLERIGRLEKSTKNPDSKLAVPSQEPPPNVQHPHKISIPGCRPSSCTAHMWGPPAAHPLWGWLMALGGSWCPRWRRPV